MLFPELPDPRDLGPWLRKMEANPGSCVIITIEPRNDGKRPDVRLAWLSGAERKKARRAMIECNISRGLRDEALLTEPPQ
jgi:hypothetical protein